MPNKNVGGQAVIEGVMMRGGTCLATAVRKPNGEIVYKKTKISSKKSALEKVPFIRGAVMLFDTLILGIKELVFSANQAEEKEEEVITDKQAAVTAVISLGLGVGLFILLPSFISNMIFRNNRAGANLVEAVLRLVFFVVYIWLISFSKDIKRVFQYHGAEHKTIYAFEHKMELTPENCQKHTTLHPRCGTSFMLIVMIVSIIVFMCLDFIIAQPENYVLKILVRLLTRVIFVPIVAGISYEIQKYSSRHIKNKIIKFLSSPGLSLQKITTQEPDDEQVEVAIVALKVATGQEVDNAREVFK